MTGRVIDWKQLKEGSRALTLAHELGFRVYPRMQDEGGKTYSAVDDCNGVRLAAVYHEFNGGLDASTNQAIAIASLAIAARAEQSDPHGEDSQRM